MTSHMSNVAIIYQHKFIQHPISSSNVLTQEKKNHIQQIKGKLKFRVKTSVHEVTKDDMALKKIITWMRHVHTKMYPSALGRASEGRAAGPFLCIQQSQFPHCLGRCSSLSGHSHLATSPIRPRIVAILKGQKGH